MSADLDKARLYEGTDVPMPWVRVYREVREEIRAGVLEPGDEVWVTFLARDEGVSYRTAARALRVLAEEGYLVQGRNTTLETPPAYMVAAPGPGAG